MNLENQQKKKKVLHLVGISKCYVLYHSPCVWSHQEINVGKRRGSKLLPSYK